MPLDKKDLQNIGQLIDKRVTRIVSNEIIQSESRLVKVIDEKIIQSESRLVKVIDEKIIQSEGRMSKVIDGRVARSEQEIIKTISREINDLAEINQAFIDKFDNHERRIKRLEIKTSAT